MAATARTTSATPGDRSASAVPAGSRRRNPVAPDRPARRAPGTVRSGGDGRGSRNAGAVPGQNGMARSGPVERSSLPVDLALAASVGPCRAPAGAAAELPAGFAEFFEPLHREYTARQQAFIAARRARLHAAHEGRLPDYPQARFARPPELLTRPAPLAVELPAWVRDQRNQMTGPADDAELVVKMLNSGAPGVMLDLEDSTANRWENQIRGAANILAALDGTLTYEDRKRDKTVGIDPSSTVIWIRPRGLHLSQAGIVPGELTSASLFDLARIACSLPDDAPARLRHPLAIYIPKSESAAEATWWRDVFETLADARGWPRDWIKAMALVESHPLAYEMDGFVDGLGGHLLGLNLGRWDYMASLIHYQLADPGWVLPDRNTIPHDVPFFQRLRELLVETCHARGLLAIGGMTALYPSREDSELNARALEVLERDKANEARAGMDGAWTGHPDQNSIAVSQFPEPNQVTRRYPSLGRPDLRPRPDGIGERTIDGTRAAVRTVICYRAGVLSGRGASLLDGYMEDLATDRIYRLMLAQRLRHSRTTPIRDGHGAPVVHTPELLTELFDEELERILREPRRRSDSATPEVYRRARTTAEAMIRAGAFDPA